MQRTHHVTMVAALALVLGSVVCALLLRYFYDTKRLLRCKGTLTGLAANVMSGDTMTDDAAYCTRNGWVCPGCSKPYGFRPVAGQRRFVAGPTKGVRIIAWCPDACHRGVRNMLLENGAVVEVSEERFQKVYRNKLDAKKDCEYVVSKTVLPQSELDTPAVREHLK